MSHVCPGATGAAAASDGIQQTVEIICSTFFQKLKVKLEIQFTISRGAGDCDQNKVPYEQTNSKYVLTFQVANKLAT